MFKTEVTCEMSSSIDCAGMSICQTLPSLKIWSLVVRLHHIGIFTFFTVALFGSISGSISPLPFGWESWRWREELWNQKDDSRKHMLFKYIYSTLEQSRVQNYIKQQNINNPSQILRVVLSYVGDVGNSVLSKKFHYNTKWKHKCHHDFCTSNVTPRSLELRRVIETFEFRNASWPGIIKLIVARERLISGIPAGDGKIMNFFYSIRDHKSGLFKLFYSNFLQCRYARLIWSKGILWQWTFKSEPCCVLVVVIHNGGFFNNCTPKRCLHIPVHFQTNAL